MTRFVRSSSLWILYSLLGLYAYLQNAIGPAVPFLRDEFHLDHTVAALHISAFAVGMIIAGFLAPTALRRWGVHKVLWGGQIGTWVGMTLLILAPVPALSLAAILFAAVTGTIGLAAIQMSVSQQAGPHRGQALVEANMAASVTSALAPFVLVMGTLLGTGWRTLWAALTLGIVVILLWGRAAIRREIPDRIASDEHAVGRLPRRYAAAWILIFLGVSVEWCVGFWATDYLKGLPGHSLVLAAAGAGTFQLASLTGRFFASRVAGRWGERRLLATAMVVAAVGFPLYWGLWSAPISFLGLALCGFGVSHFYPVGLSMALGASGPRPDQGSSFAALAAGTAILAAPLTLGALADLWGLSWALLAVPLGLAAMAAILALWTAHRRTR